MSKHILFELTVAGGYTLDAFEAEAALQFGNASSSVFGCNLLPRRLHGLVRSVACAHRSRDTAATTRANWTRDAIDTLLGLTGVTNAEERARAQTNNFWSRNAVTRGAAHPIPFTGPRGLGTGSVLSGRGQVVGALDTGLDLFSVFFRETTGGAPYVGCNAQGYPLPNQREIGPVSFPGRKVVQYVFDASGSGACGDRFDLDGHGSHTSGTNVGQPNCATGADGAACPLTTLAFSGVAPGASIAMFDAGPATDGSLIVPDDPGRVAEWTSLAGGHVHSNSWGADTGNTYSSFDQSLDSYAYLHPETLFVVAAGNDGDSTGFGSVASPGLAKNAITVGAAVSSAAAFELAFCGNSARQPSDAMCSAYAASDRSQDIAFFSSFGYAHAGRRAKPDVVAPSFYVWSAAAGQPAQVSQSAAFQSAPWSSGLLEGMGGTSMATPAVAGAALLVRQYFAEGWWPCGYPGSGPAWASIPASLVKAVLIAAASPLTGNMESTDSGGTRLRLADTGYPSYVQGYGQPSLLSVLRVLGETDFLRTPPLEMPALAKSALPDGVGAEPVLSRTGATLTFVVCPWNHSDSRGWTAHSAAMLTATLVWTDLPAFAGIDGHSDLVNDLDLSLWSTATGTLLARGNDHVLPSMTGSPLRTNPLAQPDTTSNVERMSIPRASAPASMQIQVTASYLLAPQRFSLVLTGGWGSCSVPGELLCPANQTNQTSISPADAVAASPAPTVVNVWQQDFLYLYTGVLQLLLLGTTQTCSEAGACADPTSVEYAELVLSSTALLSSATRTVRIRTPAPQEALALCGPNATPPLLYPRGALLLRNWIRVSLSSGNGTQLPPLQISLPAIMDGHRGILDQDVLFCVVGDAVWQPLPALAMTESDAIDLSVPALRIHGTTAWLSTMGAVDVLLVQRVTLPGNGVASHGAVDSYCDPQWRGCDCQYAGASSKRAATGQQGNWTVAALAAAMATIGLCALWVDGFSEQGATTTIASKRRAATTVAGDTASSPTSTETTVWLEAALSCFLVSVSSVLLLSASREWEHAIALASVVCASLRACVSVFQVGYSAHKRSGTQTLDTAGAALGAVWCAIATVYLCMIFAYGPSTVLDSAKSPDTTYAHANSASYAPYASLFILVVCALCIGVYRTLDLDSAPVLSRAVSALLHTSWAFCFLGMALQRSTGVQLVAVPIAMLFVSAYTRTIPVLDNKAINSIQLLWTCLFPYVYNRLPCE